MELDFLKMQGSGEDLVVLDRVPREDGEPPADPGDLPRLASRILARTTGVGASALAVLTRGTRERLAAEGWSAAGEPCALSSSALRCVARYASDAGLVTAGDFRIETGDRSVRATVIDSLNVRVEMGMPFGPEQAAAIREKPAASFSRGIVVGERTVSYTPVSLGTPWAVVFVTDFSFPVAGTARRIAAHPDFAEGVGIGFVQVRDRETLRVRAWRPRPRGAAAPPPGDADFAAAAIVAAVVHGFADREAFARLPGGAVYLQWDEADNRVYLTGPAVYVFTGTYDFDEAPPRR
jgi:diaminopimelate epimerase